MVTLNSIKPALGSRRKPKRLGRGTGSGQGCTAGHGNNGAKARSGDSWKPYFEGGQTPLSRRIPKRGFTNRNSIQWQVVNIGDISKIESNEKEIGLDWLLAKGLIKNKDYPVKILGGGECTRPLSIKAHAFSKTAKEKIEKSKGKVDVETRV